MLINFTKNQFTTKIQLKGQFIEIVEQIKILVVKCETEHYRGMLGKN